MSGSRYAGETVGGKLRQCSDVLVIQGDNEGIMGAVDSGLEPGFVLETTDCDTWEAYQSRLAGGLRELREQLFDGTIKVVVIDLSWPARLIDMSIDPAVQKDWKLVAQQGARLFRALSGLRNVTVIGNAQIKAASAPGETQQSIDAGSAKAIGGERSTFTVDLPKGIAAMWLDNCSFVFARDAKRVKDARGNPGREYRTITQSTHRFEAKSRAGTKLLPTEPGNRSLYSLMLSAYGETSQEAPKV